MDFEDDETKRCRACYTFHTCCVAIILKVLSWAIQEQHEQRMKRGYSYSRPFERAAAMCGVSLSSLYRLRNEDKVRLGPGEAEERDRGMAMSAEDLAEIRPAIIELILAKKPLRLDTILMQLQANNPEWTWSRETLRKAMISIGITFQERIEWYYPRLREDEDNCLRRAKYLSYFFKYLAEGRTFNFFDETWFNKNMVEAFEWSDGSVEFDRGVPPGVGDRWIAMGCGNKESGWMRSLFKIWKGDSKIEDYHGNMDASLFESWVHEYTGIAKDRSVLVIDRASYHVMLTTETRRATTAMNRPSLAQWLIDHAVVDENGILYTAYVLLDKPGRSPSGRKLTGLSKLELY
jgi:hypothetical protein